MTDLLHEIDEDLEEEKEKRERVLKENIIIQLNDNMRVVLMSDRRNLKMQTKSEKVNDEISENEEDEIDRGWVQRGYFGTRDWQGVIEKACALSSEQKLSRNKKNELEDLNNTIKDNTKEIKYWAKEITNTLINNNIKL